MKKFSKLSKFTNRTKYLSLPPWFDNKKYQRNYVSVVGTTVGVTGALALGAFGYLATRYKVAAANEYLVRTGILIDDIDISKKAFLLPYQTMTRINLEPTTYHCVIQEAMSNERISFNMPTVFTVGPKDDLGALKIYAKLLQQCKPEDLSSKITGIIQGETRMAAGKVSLNDLFNNREEFKKHIVDSIDKQLACFGLSVYNANIEELRDMAGNEYFVFLRKRALEGAVNDAKVAVAEQNKKGNIGESQHLTESRQKVAEFEKNAKLTENERDKEIAESAAVLAVARAEYDRQKKVAEIEATAAADKRMLDLQREVEEYRNRQTMEQLRASQFTQATVTAEVDIKKSEGIATAAVREATGKADSLRLQAQAEADSERIRAEGRAIATKLQAEADAEAEKMRAEAHYISKENEAKGIIKLREAEALGLERLIQSAGSVNNLSQYLMVRDDMITRIAEQQAKAVHDMKPKVNVWQTDRNATSNTINELVKSGMPLLDGIREQFGIDPLKAWREEKK